MLALLGFIFLGHVFLRYSPPLPKDEDDVDQHKVSDDSDERSERPPLVNSVEEVEHSKRSVIEGGPKHHHVTKGEEVDSEVPQAGETSSLAHATTMVVIEVKVS